MLLAGRFDLVGLSVAEIVFVSVLASMVCGRASAIGSLAIPNRFANASQEFWISDRSLAGSARAAGGWSSRRSSWALVGLDCCVLAGSSFGFSADSIGLVGGSAGSDLADFLERLPRLGVPSKSASKFQWSDITRWYSIRCFVYRQVDSRCGSLEATASTS
jgi:hypothetical protein